MPLKLSKRRIMAWLIAILLASNLFFIVAFLIQKDSLDRHKRSELRIEEYSLLDPKISSLGISKFEAEQERLKITYSPLRKKIESIINTSEGRFSVYFEDLKSGSWIGINEKEEFIPASLLKVPILVAALKMIEDEELGMSDKLMVKKEDINSQFGILGNSEIGKEYSIEELLKLMIHESDNTAMVMLRKRIPYDRLMEARLALGLPLSSMYTEISGTTKLSTKQYTNIFRSLYLSSYLKKAYSQWALGLLAGTQYTSWIASGVGDGITVSHKIGVWVKEGSYHDCGIVYYSPNPYMLCIMSRKSDEIESKAVMKKISKEIFLFVSS